MRLFRSFSLFVATIIVLLHSIVAHSHESDLSESAHISEHQEASSILEFIALGFHGDHLDGQLEFFTGSSEISIERQDLIHFSPNFCAVLTVQGWGREIELSSSVDFIVRDNLQPRTSSLRGPPSLI